MELFLLFSVISAFLLAIATLLAKHVIDLGVEDCTFLGSIYSWPFFLAFILIGLVKGGMVLDLKMSLMSFLAGSMYFAVLIYYLKGLGSEEASRFIPVLSINTVFLAILSFVFLGETFTRLEYTGMLMAVFGAFLISIEDLGHLKQLHSRTATFIALGMAAVQASRDLIVEFMTQTVQIWPVLFWMGLGGITTSFIVLGIFERQEFEFSRLIDEKSMMVIGGLHALGYVFYAVAISIGAAAKASAVLRINPIFVFLGATALAFVDPGFIEEEKEWDKIIQKLVASLIIIVGVLLLR